MVSTAQDLVAKRAQIIKEHGEWIRHNIKLSDDLYTMSPDAPSEYLKALQAYLQIAVDCTGKPLNELRVLDLGAGEGQYSIEFAKHGAQVVAIEGRVANIEKIKFAVEALALTNCQIVQDDVRNISAEKYGTFDLVLCLGLYYHLDEPEMFEFVEKMYEVTGRVMIMNTHYSLFKDEMREYKGHKYWGFKVREHHKNINQEELDKNLLASLDNIYSYWLTETSLTNILTFSGYSSVYQIMRPFMPQGLDRIQMVAIKSSERPSITTGAVAVQHNFIPDDNYVNNKLAPLHIISLAVTNAQPPVEVAIKMQEHVRNYCQANNLPFPQWLKNSTNSEAAELRRELANQHRQKAEMVGYIGQLEKEWQAKNDHIQALETQLSQQQTAARNASGLIRKVVGKVAGFIKR